MVYTEESGVKTSTMVEEECLTREAADAFAQGATAHPAVRESFGVASDIYERLFDEFFHGALFNRWIKHKDLWQLHVVGGPGAGKVSLLLIKLQATTLTPVLDYICSYSSYAHSPDSCEYSWT
jgi:hypothetical protein